MFIEPSQLSGVLRIPPSKSHTLRAILFGALAKGVSHVHNILKSPDTAAMIEAVRGMGAIVIQEGDSLRITGGNLHPPKEPIQCGNSGLVLRFVGAIASLFPSPTILNGDESIQTRRPALPLLDGINQLGGEAVSIKGNGLAPLSIRGPLTKTFAQIDGEDSQPVSALLIAGIFHPIELSVTNPGEKPWIDLTLDWFRRLSIPFEREGYSHYKTKGLGTITPFTYTVPADFSTAAFPIGAALVTRSTLTIGPLDFNDPQGDREVISVLKKMGARFEGKLTVYPSDLHGIEIDVNPFIDALPILAVIATSASSPTILYNGKIARRKESDRISAIATELKKMGARTEEKEDGLKIYPSHLSGAHLSTHNDHRIGLSLAMAALRATGPTHLHSTLCIDKTYPRFVEAFRSIGAKITE